MKTSEALEFARQKIENTKYKSALKILATIYKADPNNIDVLRELTVAYEGLDKPQKALQAISKAIHIDPTRTELWVQRAMLHTGVGAQDKRLADIEHALLLTPTDPDLLRYKAGVFMEQGNYTGVSALFEKAMTDQPEDRAEYLAARADVLSAGAFCDPENAGDSKVVKDLFGMCYAVEPLEMAVADYSALISEGDEVWRFYLKRADVQKRLQRFDAAIEDYDQALAGMDESESGQFKSFIESERESCLNNGQAGRERLINSISEGMYDDVSDRERNTDDFHLAENMVDAALDQIRAGGSLNEAFDTMITDDPQNAIAISIARDILQVGFEKEPELAPAEAKDFPSAARRHCRKAEIHLGKQGFNSLGDFIPTHLAGKMGKPVLMRLFIGEENTVTAAAYKFYPRRPGWLTWLIMVCIGQWKKPAIVELETEFSDGSYVITNNTGDGNPFGAGPKFHLNTLPMKTSVTELVETHRRSVQERLSEAPSLQPQTIADMAELVAFQDRLRLAKNKYRESIDYITDDELKKLLGKHYEKLAEKVREKINQMAPAMA